MNQLHFELVALEKPLTELTTLAASEAITAICVGDGLDGSALTALTNESTDDLIALVSLGKSLLAESTRVVASSWIVLSWLLKPLTPPESVRLVSPLMELWRLSLSEQ